MGEERVEGQRQEQCVCVEIGDCLEAPALAQPLAAFPREGFTPCLTASTQNAFISVPECRICQEEEDPSQLETPCDCSGTLKYAHRQCVQRWCDEKGDTICEICQQPYRHGYNVSQLRLHAGSVAVDLSDTWRMELRDPRILALAAAQRRFMELNYEDVTAVSSGSAVCCRSVALILMALLLLRHATAIAAATGDQDALMFLMIFLLRVAGFLLPCYILIRAMNTLHRGQQQQVQAAAAMTAALLRARHHPRGIRVALVPAVDLP